MATKNVEQTYLSKIESFLSNRITELTEKARVQKAAVIADKKSIFTDVSTNDATELAFRREENSKAITRAETDLQEIHNLKSMISSPYFGHFTFKETDDMYDEDIYVGFHGLMTAGYENLIYDWRTPIASMYYDYGVGPAEFYVPATDGTIKGALTSKTQLIIRNGHLENMVETDQVFSEELLRDELSQATSSKMRNIVSTIQEEQNEIIRFADNADIIVQGVAGSGKTSVALHRIAFLLYKYRDTLRADNFLLLAPNTEFADYVNQVLPEMGETMIPTLAFDDVALRNLPANFINALPNKNDFLQTTNDMAEMALHSRRTSNEMVKALQYFTEIVANDNFQAHDLKIFNQTYPANSLAALYEQRKNMPIKNQIQLFTQVVFDALKSEITSSKYNDYRAEIASEIRRMYQWTTLTQLFEGFERYLSNELRRPDNRLRYADLFILAKLNLLIETPKAFPNDIKYLIVDEMQDYSPVQYAYLSDIFRKQTKLFLGDEYQQLYAGGSSLSAMTKLFPSANVLRLDRSYRSTSEIMAFASKFIEQQINVVDRHGLEVTRIDEAEIIDIIANNEDKTIALITPISKDIQIFGERVSINTALAKGLEYDIAVLIGFDVETHSEFARNELYVAATRATKQLYLA